MSSSKYGNRKGSIQLALVANERESSQSFKGRVRLLLAEDHALDFAVTTEIAIAADYLHATILTSSAQSSGRMSVICTSSGRRTLCLEEGLVLAYLSLFLRDTGT